MKLTSIADLQVPGAKLLEQLAQSLNQLYDDFLDDFPEPDDRAPGIHASEICACKRQTYYTLLAVPKKRQITGFWRKRFQVGHALHDMIQSHFELMAANSNGRFTFTREVKIQDYPLAQELFLVSSCDGVFTFYENGVAIVRIALEIKSKSPKEYEKLKKPEPKHVEQSHLYLKVLDIPLVWYLYWDKGTQNYTPSSSPYLAFFDEAVWARIEKRSREVIEAAETNTLPDREEDMHCQWCPYQHLCLPASVKPKYGTRVHLPLSGRR